MSDLAEQQPQEEPQSVEELRKLEEKEPQQELVEGAEEQQQQRPEKLVKIQALDAERHKRKEIQQQLEKERREREAERAVLADRFNQLYAAAQQRNEPQVDPNDPIAVHDKQLQLTQQELAQIKQRQAHEDWQRQQAQRVQGLASWARTQAVEFAKEAPDFQDAYKHVVTNRAKQLEAMGLEPQAVQEALVRDELWVYEHAYQTGRNPAQVVYEMAKNTGYGGKAAQKIEQLQKGVQASASLGSGGSSGNQWPTPEQIASMPEGEFESLKKRLSKAGKDLSDIL